MERLFLHIMEGFLPWYWCIFWYLLSIPVVVYGIVRIKKIVNEVPESKSLLAVSGAFMFVISSLKLPSIMGSSSHPTGNGLGAVLFGPAVTAVLATMVLVFQAILLAHGGITTLGANIFSMGIVGPSVAYLVYKSFLKINKSSKLLKMESSTIAIFLAAFLANLLTYVVTSFQLALAFPQPTFTSSFSLFLGIFAITQIPLAIAEGLLTVVIWNGLTSLKPRLLEKLNVLKTKPMK